MANEVERVIAVSKTPPPRKDQPPRLEDVEADLKRRRERLRRDRKRKTPKRIGEFLRKLLR